MTSRAGAGTAGATLPDAAQRFIDPTNAEDAEALLAAFTKTATVDDFGRTCTGLREIAEWSARENVGTYNRIAVRSAHYNDAATIAAIVVTGEGYNGDGTFVFEIADDLIAQLTIRG